MDPSVAARYKRGLNASLTWHPDDKGTPGIICFRDNLAADLGPDEGAAFDCIADRMMSGHYYPPDAIETFGEFEGREIRPGDRILQKARLFPFWDSPAAWSMVEIFVAKRTDQECHIGYVTTTDHHGRGIWQAHLQREDGRLTLSVQGLAAPNSWLFWLGLPYARYLQRRAWRRAIEEFRKVKP